MKSNAQYATVSSHHFDEHPIIFCMKSNEMTSSCFSFSDYLRTVAQRYSHAKMNEVEKKPNTTSIHLFLKLCDSIPQKKLTHEMFHCFSHIYNKTSYLLLFLTNKSKKTFIRK